MATRVAARAAPLVLRRIGRGLAVPLAAATAALLGCGRTSDQTEVARTVRSWDATLALLDKAEAGGAAPKEFGQQLRTAADQERARAREKLQKSRAPAP